MLGFLRRKRQAEEFESLVAMLVEGKRFRRKEGGFADLCSSFKTSRVTLDNMLHDIVGMSGDDVLTCLRMRNRLIEH